MLNKIEQSILFDISLSLVEEGLEGVDLKRVLNNVLRKLNCSSGRIYFYQKQGERFHFELARAVPKRDSALDDYMNECFWEKGSLRLDNFEELRERLPVVEMRGDNFFHILDMKNVGVVVLKRASQFDYMFIQTLGQIMDRLAMVIHKERMEQQIARSSHMANVGHMTSGIAHEINNPLSIVMLQCQILERYLSKGQYQKMGEAVTTVLRAGERIRNIVESLRSLSRNESDLPLEEFSVETLLDECQFYSQQLIAERGVEVTFPKEVDSNLRIIGRTVQISQVLINLVKNAIEEVYEKRDPWVKIEVVDLPKTVELRVVDSGKGIQSDVLKRIMDPFFTTKEKGKGTGIGLSLSKRILESQDADLHYDREQSNTTFVMTLKKVV